MNTASALLKQVLTLKDVDTWSYIRKNYLPQEFHSLFTVITRHYEANHKLPTFEELKYEIRDNATREKLFLVESVEVDVDAYQLLQYVKNEYTQKEILDSIEEYVESSIAFENAEESVRHLHQIVLDIENKVELSDESESMQRIELFDSEEELSKFVTLGLNDEYDQTFAFRPTDLILIGGKRGKGKSLVSANIAVNMYERGKSAMYFTIEMTAKETLQRMAAIGSGVNAHRLVRKMLNTTEWAKVAEWWAGRFEGGEEPLKDYYSHRSFDRLHHELSTRHSIKQKNQIDIIYDPSLTLSKIRAEIDKKFELEEPAIIIVDYVNQVKRSGFSTSKGGQYDWTEQIEISKALKLMAQEYKVPFVSPYQIDDAGNARFSKGLLDAVDAAFLIDSLEKKDNCMQFKCTKMRNGAEVDFMSKVNWESLKIGPENAVLAEDGEEPTGEVANDL